MDKAKLEALREYLDTLLSDEYYYDPEAVDDLAVEIGTSIRDTLKYLVSCVVDGADAEDAAKLTPELLENFRILKEDAEEYIDTYTFQTTKLELYKEAVEAGEWDKIQEDIGEYGKFCARVAHSTAQKQGKLDDIKDYTTPEDVAELAKEISNFVDQFEVITQKAESDPKYKALLNDNEDYYSALCRLYDAANSASGVIPV
jgi:t-SNARE complex subunit (syntaxin)